MIFREIQHALNLTCFDATTCQASIVIGLLDIRFGGGEYEVGTIRINYWLFDICCGRNIAKFSIGSGNHRQIYAQPRPNIRECSKAYIQIVLWHRIYWTTFAYSALAKNLIHHLPSKHIEVKYHFVRDCIKKKKLALEKVSMIDNMSDAMMKSLPKDRF